MSEDLLPCPFCGASDQLVTDFGITCRACHTQVVGSGTESDEVCWNRRPARSQAPPPLGEGKQELSSFGFQPGSDPGPLPRPAGEASPSGMVERVAMALSDAAFANTKAWDHSPEAYKVIWRQYARAAIEAMRGPTSPMVEVGGVRPHEWGAIETVQDTYDLARAKWSAMIDAALSRPQDLSGPQRSEAAISVHDETKSTPPPVEREGLARIIDPWAMERAECDPETEEACAEAFAKADRIISLLGLTPSNTEERS